MGEIGANKHISFFCFNYHFLSFWVQCWWALEFRLRLMFVFKSLDSLFWEDDDRIMNLWKNRDMIFFRWRIAWFDYYFICDLFLLSFVIWIRVFQFAIVELDVSLWNNLFQKKMEKEFNFLEAMRLLSGSNNI